MRIKGTKYIQQKRGFMLQVVRMCHELRDFICPTL